MAERAPFPFFLGCGRSGTTLIRAMFDAHPQVAIPPGIGLVKSLAKQRDRYEAPAAFDTERFLADVVAADRFASWELDDPTLRAVLDPEPADLADALRRIYGAYAAAQGKPRYGNKSHGYVMAMPLIASLFPEARFVHIVRDGRNVALSLMEAPFGPSRIEHAARFWRLRVERGREDGRRLGAERYREVRYEDLVADPPAVVPDLCAFLDLPYEPSMLRYYEQQTRLARGLKYPEIHTHLAEPPRRNIRDWRKVLPAGDVARFESIAGPALGAFGYERTRVPWRMRMSLWAHRRLRTAKRLGLVAQRRLRHA